MREMERAAMAALTTAISSKSRSPVESPTGPPILRAFLLHLASERGLADNSLHAYRRDLEDMEDYFIGIRKSLITADGNDFRIYLQNQTRKGQSTKTVARRLAAIRVFLRFLPSIGHD